MLSAVDLMLDDDDRWTPPKLYRGPSVGSWGVTSIGRGFDWGNEEEENAKPLVDSLQRKTTVLPRQSNHEESQFLAEQRKFMQSPFKFGSSFIANTPSTTTTSQSSLMTITASPTLTTSPLDILPPRSPSPSLILPRSGSIVSLRPSPLSRSPSSPRPRRRSSQQRVSLIAGRVSIAPIEPPSPPPTLLHSLSRAPSTSSASTRAPSPSNDNKSFLGGRSISEFHIEGEIGRGAYGLVKRAREIHANGSYGPPIVIKQIIKSRILADCWKKHPKHGTIPIEIYVMSAISATQYILPARRPWDPSRLSLASDPDAEKGGDDWLAGKAVYGHPNICPLQDFFEDSHFYYLVLPSSTPEQLPNDPLQPSDLFDLVENYPQGLPPSMIRSYLGQIADALCFLHSQGIVHRDIKDENVVIGPMGKCILIDFGSSGLVKKGGWDTFSGTLDYAGPEILRGERYHGKEQDVWAFGVVAYVLLVGECPFTTAAEAQEGLGSPFASACISLDERCADGKEKEGEEADGGGALGDAAALVRSCLQLEVPARPTFEKIMQCRFLAGGGGWGM